MNPRHLWLLAALALSACGGDGSDSAPAASPPAATNAPASEEAGAEAPDTEATADVAAPAPTPLAVSNDTGAPPTSARFQLGTHYDRLSPTQPTSSGPDKVEVTEMFWYGCPHCFAFDPYVQSWEASKPDYVTFVRVPAVWNEIARLHARAFYTAEALGKGAAMHTAFFREIHDKHNLLDTEDKLRDFFGTFGVDAATFKSTFDSFAVHAKLQRADELNRRYRVPSVPYVVVNGKYTTDVGKAGGYNELFALIGELTAAEHAGK